MRLARAQVALRDCKYPSEHNVIRQGDATKTDPYRIFIIANPVLRQHPTAKSTKHIVDPILSDKASFNAAVTYINQCLFGEQVIASASRRLTLTQSERLLKDPSLNGKIWVESLFIRNLEVTAGHALVEETLASNSRPPSAGQLRWAGALFRPCGGRYLRRHEVWNAQPRIGLPDKDDTSKGGVPFTFDGNKLTHWYQNLAPGVVAIHSSASTLTALHEFGHAASSTSDGKVTDLYVDNPSTASTTVNIKRGRPIPANFAKLR